MMLKDLEHGLECPECGGTAFFKDAEGYLCNGEGEPVHDADPACCGCENVWLTADEDGADVGGDW